MCTFNGARLLSKQDNGRQHKVLLFTQCLSFHKQHDTEKSDRTEEVKLSTSFVYCFPVLATGKKTIMPLKIETRWQTKLFYYMHTHFSVCASLFRMKGSCLNFRFQSTKASKFLLILQWWFDVFSVVVLVDFQLTIAFRVSASEKFLFEVNEMHRMKITMRTMQTKRCAVYLCIGTIEDKWKRKKKMNHTFSTAHQTNNGRNSIYFYKIVHIRTWLWWKWRRQWIHSVDCCCCCYFSFFFSLLVITTILRQISKNSTIFHTKGIEIASCMGHTQTNHAAFFSNSHSDESFFFFIIVVVPRSVL